MNHLTASQRRSDGRWDYTYNGVAWGYCREVLRLMVKQLGRAAHEDGLSDNEFITQVIDPFDADIKTDRAVIKMSKQRKPV